MFNGNEVTNGITAGIEVRKQRGLEIAALARIDKDGDVYLVPSVTDPRHPRYKVKVTPTNVSCTCPDHETRGCKCKHIYAVECVISRETTEHADGSTTVRESVTITKTRKTYSQDWPNYNAAQVNEKGHFQELLRDLCDSIEEPKSDKPKRGRPGVRIADAIFSIVYKVYSTRSGRRFSPDLVDANHDGHVGAALHYNTVFKYIEKAEPFPVLVDLIERAAAPLKAVESQFAVDSTGFAYSRFVRWYDIKYNRFTAEQQWIKAHFCAGTKTNVITAVTIKGRDAGDSTQLPVLVKSTAQRFDVKEVTDVIDPPGGHSITSVFFCLRRTLTPRGRPRMHDQLEPIAFAVTNEELLALDTD